MTPRPDLHQVLPNICVSSYGMNDERIQCVKREDSGQKTSYEMDTQNDIEWFRAKPDRPSAF